jgi:hypothetical protein
MEDTIVFKGVLSKKKMDHGTGNMAESHGLGVRECVLMLQVASKIHTKAKFNAG